MYDWTKNLLVKCGCYSEVLSLAYDPETHSMDLAIYQSMAVADYNKSLRYFLRLIWQWMRKGRLYSDQMILEKEEIIKLRDYLNSLELITENKT